MSQASRAKKKGNSSPSRKEPSSRLKSMATDTHSDSETVPRHEETGYVCLAEEAEEQENQSTQSWNVTGI